MQLITQSRTDSPALKTDHVTHSKKSYFKGGGGSYVILFKIKILKLAVPIGTTGIYCRSNEMFSDSDDEKS